MGTLDPQVTTKVSSSRGLLVLFNVCCGTQTQLADLEQSHGTCESLVRQREEAQREAERLRSSFREAEQTLGARERAHRHRVKGLEEQVNTSRDRKTSALNIMEPFLWPAAGFHLEGAAAAGGEATAAFSSVPLNACGKLRKASQPSATSASRQEVQGKSAHPEQPNTESSDTETSAAAILGRRWRAGEKHGCSEWRQRLLHFLRIPPQEQSRCHTQACVPVVRFGLSYVPWMPGRSINGASRFYLSLLDMSVL